ncbi:MAG: exodeoxyribonuclease VII large subunit [Limosilactobacillus sp.]|uniref:exodeoxyribonuclease VII large subunit n=1 Tax=Limosilactobacillus sp. TaxID=2773925 RepID=UPI002711CAB5|nr:exodeoxyribonuclease VII large subunit [Limosilactobacillus sp.]
MDKKYLSVSQLTNYVNRKFNVDPYMQTVFVTGEITGYNKRSTHKYFGIKDDDSTFPCVLFAGKVKQLNFEPEDGNKVLIKGRVQVYKPTARVQLMVDTMEPDGYGARLLALQQLKKKLQEEGIFDFEKKKIPEYPKRIGVVTSKSGAVIRDILKGIHQRNPIAQVVLFPATVQGENGPADIARQIKRAEEIGNLDVLIVARGGGSIDDLWTWNDEKVIRAVSECNLPVITAIGHQVDMSLTDYVADLSEGTPSYAAAAVTPRTYDDTLLLIRELGNRIYINTRNLIQLQKKQLDRCLDSYIFQQPQRLYETQTQHVSQLFDRLKQVEQNRFVQAQNQLTQLNNKLLAYTPQRQIEQGREAVNQLDLRLKRIASTSSDKRKQEVEALVKQLNSLDPLKIMDRGYTYVTKDGKVVNKAAQLAKDEEMILHFADGDVTVKITDIKEK